MQRHYDLQKQENTKIQQLISLLRNEKSNLDTYLIDLERRMAEVELQVGAGDPWEINYISFSLFKIKHELTWGFGVLGSR